MMRLELRVASHPCWREPNNHGTRVARSRCYFWASLVYVRLLSLVP